MLEAIRLTTVLPATPERIYQAWLDAAEHSAFTGARATVEPHVGGRHSAWDGYIEGTNLELDPSRRIKQSWRSSEFPEGHADSHLEVMLEPDSGGTRITIYHSDIPEGQGKKYEDGWREHYFEPMAEYFGAGGTAVEAEEEEEEDLHLIPPLVSTAPSVEEWKLDDMPLPPAPSPPPADLDWSIEEVTATGFSGSQETRPLIEPPHAPPAPEPERKVAAKKPAARSKAKPVAKKPVVKAAAKKPAAKAKAKPAAKAKAKPAAKKKAKAVAAKKKAPPKKKAPAKKKPAAKKKAPAKKKPAKKKKK